LPSDPNSVIFFSMRAVDILHKKRDGLALDRAEIDAFIDGVVSGGWTEAQTAAMLMAIVLRGFIRSYGPQPA
jgi:thymidine phosphorylase